MTRDQEKAIQMISDAAKILEWDLHMYNNSQYEVVSILIGEPDAAATLHHTLDNSLQHYDLD